MKISELSRETGVSIPSIKFYVREGLLPPGVATAANQAEYDDPHVRRLRLIRALIDVGEIPIANVRNVLAAVDNPTTTLHDAFGSVMHSFGAPSDQPATPERDEALAEVWAWIKK